MRFVVDMPLPPSLAVWLVDEGHDAVHAGEIGMHRAADHEILAYATRESRIVITADLDFPRLLALSATATASVVLFRGGDFNDATAAAYARRALMAIDAGAPRQFVIAVDRHRVRRRWLTPE